MEFDPAIEELLKAVTDKQRFIREAVAQKFIKEGKLFWEQYQTGGYYVSSNTQVISPTYKEKYDIAVYWELVFKHGYRERKHPYARIVFNELSYDKDVWFGDDEYEASQPLTPEQAYQLSREWLLKLADTLVAVANACPDPTMFEQELENEKPT